MNFNRKIIYHKGYEGKARKQKFTKKKPCGRNSFLKRK